MTNLQLRKAERKQARLRIGIFGPSGAGKTMSALKLARGMAPWEKIAVIDTENGSADLYSHLGAYNILSLTAPYQPEKYIEAIKACENAGMEVIIIDSITHEWNGVGGILEIADELSLAAKNSFTVWGKLTPRHNKFIDAILQSPCHVICCGRSKQEYVMNQVEKNGKTINVPEKVGLKAATREGFDYEMTIAFDVAINHYATTSKDRTGTFMGRPEFVICEDHGSQLKEWNESAKPDPLQQKREIMRQLTRLNLDASTKESITAEIKKHTGLDLTEDKYAEIITVLSNLEPIKQDLPPVLDEPNVEQPATTNQGISKVEPAEEEKQTAEAERQATEKEARANAAKPGDKKLDLMKFFIEQKEGIPKTDEANQLMYLEVAHNIKITNLSELTDEECGRITKKLMGQANAAKETSNVPPV